MTTEILEPFSRDYHDATMAGKSIRLPLADSMTVGETTAKAAAEWMHDYGVSMTARFDGHAPYFDDEQSRDIWRVRIRCGRKSFTVRFGQSIADSDNGIPPCVVDVLCCLTKRDPGAFDEFVGEWSDVDVDRMTVAEHRRLSRQWRAARREWLGVCRVLGECDLEWIDGIF